MGLFHWRGPLWSWKTRRVSHPLPLKGSGFKSPLAAGGTEWKTSCCCRRSALMRGSIHCAAEVSQTAEVWPELTEALEILTYRHTGGAASTAQAVEVWPELAAVVEITVTRNTGGAAHTDQALEVWPELTEQIEATTELDRGGGTAASQVVEIYPEGGG